MKNSNFKNSFVSTLAVTVVGVLLFGVNAALSETPVASPPGSGVGPTFTGLTLTGNIQNEPSLSEGGWPVTVDDGLEVKDISFFHKLVTVAGGMDIGSGDLVLNNDAGSSIKGFSANDPTNTKVTINDSLNVTGDLTTAGNTTLGGYLTIGSDQFLTADKISSSASPTKPIRFNSPIGVMSDIVSDSVYLSVLSSIKAQGWLITETSVDVHGSILNTATTDFIAGPEVVKVDLPVTVDDSLDVTGDFSLDGEVTGDLSVTGKLTADGGIGTFTRYISDSDGDDSNGHTPYIVSKLTGTATSLYCPTGSKVISCQVKPTDVAGSDIKNFSLSAYVDGALTYCEAKVYNGSDTEKKFLVYQICFDSTQ